MVISARFIKESDEEDFSEFDEFKDDDLNEKKIFCEIIICGKNWKKPFSYKCSIEQGNVPLFSKNLDSLHFVEQLNNSITPKINFSGECFLCGAHGHSQNYCPLKECTICSRFGHSEKVCLNSLKQERKFSMQPREMFTHNPASHFLKSYHLQRNPYLMEDTPIFFSHYNFDYDGYEDDITCDQESNNECNSSKWEISNKYNFGSSDENQTFQQTRTNENSENEYSEQNQRVEEEEEESEQDFASRFKYFTLKYLNELENDDDAVPKRLYPMFGNNSYNNSRNSNYRKVNKMVYASNTSNNKFSKPDRFNTRNTSNKNRFSNNWRNL